MTNEGISTALKITQNTEFLSNSKRIVHKIKRYHGCFVFIPFLWKDVHAKYKSIVFGQRNDVYKSERSNLELKELNFKDSLSIDVSNKSSTKSIVLFKHAILNAHVPEFNVLVIRIQYIIHPSGSCYLFIETTLTHCIFVVKTWTFDFPHLDISIVYSLY